MKKLEVKVETVYTIEVEFDDFRKAKLAWAELDSVERILYPKAFENTDFTMGILMKEFKEFHAHGDRSALVAKFLGFDGWKSCLFYSDKDGKVTMVVYKKGDCLN